MGNFHSHSCNSASTDYANVKTDFDNLADLLSQHTRILVCTCSFCNANWSLSWSGQSQNNCGLHSSPSQFSSSAAGKAPFVDCKSNMQKAMPTQTHKRVARLNLDKCGCLHLGGGESTADCLFCIFVCKFSPSQARCFCRSRSIASLSLFLGQMTLGRLLFFLAPPCQLC